MQNSDCVSSEPVLYSFRRCPYAIRARLALAISRVDCALREVRLSAKPREMLACSPKGTVPVLVLPNGEIIDESLDIMNWALGIRDPEGWLTRNDQSLIARIDGPFKHDLDRYKYQEHDGPDAQTHRARCLPLLRELDERIAAHGQLCGRERGFADAAIMPFIRQFAAVDPAWFGTCPLPHLKAWLADHLSSELFNRVMMKVAPWSPASPPVKLALYQS